MQDRPTFTAETAALSARAMLGLEIPLECLPGVIANLELLAQHARLLERTEPPIRPK